MAILWLIVHKNGSLLLFFLKWATVSRFILKIFTRMTTGEDLDQIQTFAYVLNDHYLNLLLHCWIESTGITTVCSPLLLYLKYFNYNARFIHYLIAFSEARCPYKAVFPDTLQVEGAVISCRSSGSCWLLIISCRAPSGRRAFIHRKGCIPETIKCIKLVLWSFYLYL